ncbi:nitroreductase family protein [Silvibacterium dinghuense]|uniref:Nitroreductase family protein n=1 Tax=Silvibacterium dinghuense TaxID=1560006 RepID=A0A4Q1SCK7_9BACT|nr:nitroreductase family protein [Silvibacterium dinghuense]RXS94956.1 nitroreductase family protein [Silvibacterium dinghuense]GGH09354.1 NADH dehydrogenase [Silvibacterium dinghuense]
MSQTTDKNFFQAVAQRRATPSFEATPVPEGDLQRILDAGLHAPSGYNMQPWRFVVVRNAEQRRKLRAAAFNQAKVEEAPVVIVACGDADGWRNGDLDEMLRMGREGGMPENYAEQARLNIPNYLSEHPNITAWLERQVMLAFTTMMWAAEVLGYDTAPMEGFEEKKVIETLKLPLSYHVVALLGIGKLRGHDKFHGGRFNGARTVFDGEYGKPLRFGS